MSCGKIIMDIARGEDNPRNSEGAFLTLKNRDVIFVYSKFKGNSHADNAAADIYMLTSHDNGESFCDATMIVSCKQESALNIMSLSLMHMQDGDIGLFYLIRKTKSLMRMYLRRSADNGKTWSDPVLATPQEGYFVVNNDRVVRLSNGNIIIPAAIHRAGFIDSPDEKGNGFCDTRADVMFFISKDDGITFETSPDKCTMPLVGSCTSGLQEPGLIELENGVLWGYARTDLGRQYEMFSIDGGRHWTLAAPSRFTSPDSPLSMKRLKSGEILAIWNPIPVYNGKSESVDGVWTGGRSPFVYAISTDDGQTFSNPIVFEGDENSGFCYCAIHCIDNAVLLSYCAGGKGDGICLTRTRIRKITYNKLMENIL